MFGGSLSVQDFLSVCDNPKMQVVPLHQHDITHNTVIEVRRQRTDKEGFQNMFNASTQTAQQSGNDSNSLFDKMAAEIKVERREKVASSQGKSIFKLMSERKNKK